MNSAQVINSLIENPYQTFRMVNYGDLKDEWGDQIPYNKITNYGGKICYTVDSFPVVELTHCFLNLAKWARTGEEKKNIDGEDDCSMWQYVSGENGNIDKKTLAKEYNVEYKLGNGKINTFSSTLINIDDKYYWFLDDDGLNIIQKDRVIIMVSQPSSYITVGEWIENSEKF